MSGEKVEFQLSKMPDGRLEAVKVTGPDGEKVKGQPRKGEEDDEDEASGGPIREKAEEKPRPKPYTAFVPRTVPRKPAPFKPKPKPAPSESAAVPGAASSEATAPGAASNGATAPVRIVF